MKIAVVGGGTAGFVAALILKQTYPKMIIDIIRSSKIGTIGVGEGTTEHWQSFMEYVGISHKDIIKKCDATYKTGIMFENWCKEDYLHSVEHYFTDNFFDISIMYSYLGAKNVKPKDLVLSPNWNSLVSLLPEQEKNITESPVSQYHFNTQKLNEFLTDFATSKGIKIYDDEIDDIFYNEDGSINYLQGKSIHNYDFYVDSTGFKKLLIGKMGAKWKSYKEHLPLNTAIVFPTENNDYPSYTLARAMDAGWMFRIPVWGRKGNGYIYDKNFIDEDDAKAEIEKVLGHAVEIKKKIEFEPGCLANPWIKNVCAIGLSANFVEPLEATSIGTSIQQSFLLANKIFGYNQSNIDQFNNETTAIMENILDFVQLHYLGGREDTDFWKHVKTLPITPSLSHKLDMWKHRMPVNNDCTLGSDSVLFLAKNFFIVAYSLGLLDQKSLSKQFMAFPDNIQKYCKNKMLDFDNLLKTGKFVKHKEILEMIRSHDG